MIRMSVVVPLYNKKNYVLRALDSILRQTIPPAEIIVVDDGSTDGSSDVVAGLRNPLIRIVRKENGGPGSARNRGVKEARCEYVAFLDADDEWKETFLERIGAAMAAFAGRKVGIFTAVSDRRRADYRIPAMPENETFTLIESFCKPTTYGYVVNSSTAVIAKTVLEEIGPFSEKQRNLEDVDMWIRISLRYPIVRVNEALTIIHYDDASGINRRIKCRPPLIQVDSICRFFSCAVDDIPREYERRFCVDELYRYCKGMLRWGKLEEFDANFKRSRFDFRRRTILRLARALHFLIPRRSEETSLSSVRSTET